LKEKLEALIQKNKVWAKNGKVADYIPKLAEVNKELLGITVVDDEGIYQAGNWDYQFTLQSISKVFSLMLALSDNGYKEVFAKVGMEPTGDPYNSLLKLEIQEPAKPLNPMINAGAIAVTSLIKGNNSQDRFERILDLTRTISGNPQINYNKEVYRSEWETADRNRALAYFLKDIGIIKSDVEEILDVYFKQCSIELNSKDLAQIGYFLAKQGCVIGPAHKVVCSELTRIVKTFMVTCGMYDGSGEFAIRVGIPAKSGVSGGILALVPNRMGVGVFSPALDPKGNSICGVHLLEDLSKDLDLSIF